MSVIRTTTRQIALLSIILVVLSGSQCFADLFNGSISTPDLLPGGMIGNSDWQSNVTLSWEIELKSESYYHYKYTFEAEQKELSHIILEVSSDFTTSDFIPGSLFFDHNGDGIADPLIWDLGEYDPDDPGNSLPGMPSTIAKGIKFEDQFVGKKVVWEFDSYRVPMWGDFYANDGTGSSMGPIIDTYDVFAFNVGFGTDFTLADAGSYAAYIAGDGLHVATPDTRVIPVPGAVLLGLLGLSAAGIKLRRFA